MFANLKLGIASISLGQHASHTLPLKIEAATDAGFAGIEIVYGDLKAYAESKSLSIHEGARQVRKLCEQCQISIISLAALENFEGVRRVPLNERLAKAKHWCEIARTLGVEFLQVPSTFERDIDTDRRVIVSELQQLSDLACASESVIKVAYENLSWSSHCTLWEEALQIVREVDRDNFGLCLDSFHIITALWADPFVASGRQIDGDQMLERSLQSFVRDCPLDKIFYVQLSDGELLNPPYSPKHPWYDSNLESCHVWSWQARPFPLETDLGAYMPVEQVAEAFLVKKHFSGWVSLETFDRRMREEANGPAVNALRGMNSWQRLQRSLLNAPSKL